MTDDYTTGADFGRATASWFGLDVDKVSHVRFSNPLHEPLTVTITIQINPDDVTGIGKRMKEMAAGSNRIVEPVAPKPPAAPPPPPTRFSNNRVSPAEEQARYDAEVAQWKVATAAHFKKSKGE